MVYRELRWACPRDGHRLEAEQVGDTRFMRCGQCRGVLVELAHLRTMCEEMGGDLPQGQQVSIPRRPLACPACGEALVVKRLGGLEIDCCEHHGVWFDRSELGWLLESIGLEALRRRG